ncbi:DUF5829 family protein [Limnofasciculus baicalensis]|uniref:DUF5829 family protein n=1 Tax=Limnofasciculus baicalensis BBK-W-15 TaxID=2699891 RepID=A0AAE3KSH5_9CYAN|nr:DUF5829 family protein [Limnofasciculus baicalensis]MCP2729482.1 DUF5829 family protein [Limnofasciculus baicalensis BBK-W-15]
MAIEFNHLYITLNPETLESIAKSEFIDQQFCTMSTDTVKTDAESWTGTYLRGKNAYVELFPPGGAEGLKEGFSGLGFNSPQAGEIDIVKEKLRSFLKSPEILSYLQVRQTEVGQVPWFHYLSINPAAREAFASWLMEFHQDYLDYKNIKLTSGGCFDRAAYLKDLNTSETCLFTIALLLFPLIPIFKLVISCPGIKLPQFLTSNKIPFLIISPIAAFID